MKNFIFKTFIWLTICVSIYLIIFKLLTILHFPDYLEPAYNDKNNNYLFADSHGFQINTDTIGFTNLSFGAENYLDIKNKIKYLINNNNKIDTILLTYDDHMFQSYRENLNNNHISSHLNSNSLINDIILMSKYSDKYISIFQKSLSFRFKKIFKKEVFKAEDNFNNYNFEQKQIYVKNRLSQQYTSLSVSQQNYFKDIIDLSISNNFKIIIVKFPLPKIFLKEKNKIFKEKLTNKTTGLTLFDFSELITDDNFYRDQDHLNLVGKQEFVKLLSNKLRLIKDKP